MKKFFTVCIMVSAFLFSPLFTGYLLADNPPDPGGDPTGDPVGGGTPIGGGLIMLVAMGTAYGIKKVYNLKKDNQ